MFRTSLIICASLLIHGIAAKPNKPWNKHVNVAIQDTIMNENGVVDWGLQVEPLEDLDVTSYDIIPRMKIWQSVPEMGPGGKYQTAEEDLEEEEVRGYLAPLIGNIGISRPKPEEDMDDYYHGDDLRPAMKVDVPAPVGSDLMGQPEVRLHLEPEEDMDDLYHGDHLHPAMKVDVPAQVGSDVMGQPEVRLHLEPEEDMDDLYHGDHLHPAMKVDVPAQVGSDVMGQPEVRFHLEPEEDMDDLYHGDQLMPVVPYQELPDTPDADAKIVADIDDL